MPDPKNENRDGGIVKRVPVDKFGRPLSQERINNKKIASMAIAKSGRFGMLDVAYGFGLNFNPFEKEGV
jgi:hypothetical protein